MVVWCKIEEKWIDQRVWTRNANVNVQGNNNTQNSRQSSSMSNVNDAVINEVDW